MADESKYPTRLAPYGLRIPPELKARIQASAEANSRSLHSEIIQCLEDAYPEPTPDESGISQAIQTVYQIVFHEMPVKDPVDSARMAATVSSVYLKRFSPTFDEQADIDLVRSRIFSLLTDREVTEHIAKARDQDDPQAKPEYYVKRPRRDSIREAIAKRKRDKQELEQKISELLPGARKSSDDPD